MTVTFFPFPYLETERLSLWQLEWTDAADILTLRSDPRVNKYIDRSAMTSIEEAAHFIAKINEGIKQGTWIFWAVADKKTKKFYGTICLWNIVKEEGKVELGYELLHEAGGHGYMSEAIAKVLEFGAQKMNVKTVEAIIMEGNERSIKLAEKHGFVYEGWKESNMIYTLKL